MLIIMPDTPFLNVWNAAMSLLLLFTCVQTPLVIAFDSFQNSSAWQVTGFVIDIFFTIDMLITFNTAYMSDDYNIIKSRKMIAQRYISSWFFVDLFAVMPF